MLWVLKQSPRIGTSPTPGTWLVFLPSFCSSIPPTTTVKPSGSSPCCQRSSAAGAVAIRFAGGAPTNELNVIEYFSSNWSACPICGVTSIVVPASCVPPNEVVVPAPLVVLLTTYGCCSVESNRADSLLLTRMLGTLRVEPRLIVCTPAARR